MRTHRILAVAVAATVAILLPATVPATARTAADGPPPPVVGPPKLPGLKLAPATLALPKPPPLSGALAVYGPYYIHSAYQSGKDMCLDGDANNLGDGARVQLWGCNYTAQQTWWVHDLGNNYYLYENGYGPRRILDVYAPCRFSNGCRVQLWRHVPGNENQVWYVWLDSFLYARIQSAVVGGRQLDANANYPRGTDGTPVQIWGFIDGQLNQEWWY